MLPSWRDETTAAPFLPTLAVNLLPLGGILALEWRVAELLAVYWLEIGTSLLVYGVAALFAERPVVVDGRRFRLPGVKSPDQTGVPSDYERPEKWERDPDPVETPGSLPPVYPRNTQLVVLSVGTGAAWLGFFLVEYPAIVRALRSPALALAAAAMVLGDVRRLYREFFARNQYESMSPHMVLEIPGRLLFFALIYVVALSTVGLLAYAGVVALVETAVGVAVPRVRAELLVAVAAVAGKVAVEWSRFSAERQSDPTGFAAWFVPEDPRE